MGKYILKRLGLMVVTAFIIMTILFMMIRLMPVDTPVPPDMPVDYIPNLRKAYGYDEPLLVQYGIFLKHLFTKFDWGKTTQLPPKYTDVTKVVLENLPSTMYVNLFSIFFSIPIGLGLGIFAALKKNKWQDQLISILVMVAISVPSFVVAFLIQYIFAFKLEWFSPLMAATSIDGWWSWKTFSSVILPIFALSFGSIAGFTRYTRAELTEVLTSEFMSLARAKGLTRTQATIRHALRNSMVPIFPMIIGEFISIMSGSLIVERIFSIPGIGSIYLDAVNTRDYNVFLFLSMFYVAIGLLAGLVVDLSYGFVDPRIRIGGGKR